MLSTREIATHLANAAQQFPFLGIESPEALLEVVCLELGHEQILDQALPYGKNLARAIGPQSILHIISGNTPHAGLQSLIRGLLLKSHNYCKIPSSGLPEIAQFRDALPESLANCVEISPELPDTWLASANALIVFGSDETIAHFRALSRPDQIFLGHGHKVSFGIVFEDAEFASVELAARDFSVFDQQGCLSPHLIYVKNEPLAYAERLAAAMESYNLTDPRSSLSAHQAAQIQEVRQDYQFRAASTPGIRVWASPSSTDWTVIFDPSPAFTVSCLNRVAFIKPLPAEFALSSVARHLSTIGIWPATAENAAIAARLGAPRVCPLGRMQSPPFSWHQDAEETLAPLVKWQDLEF